MSDEMGACCQPKRPEPPKPACCHAPAPGSSRRGWWSIGLCAALSAINMTLAMRMGHSAGGVAEGAAYWRVHGFLIASTVAVLALLGGPLLRGTLGSLRRRELSLEALFMLSVLGALALSLRASLTGHGGVFYDVIPVVIAIHTLGSLLGERSRAQADAALAALRTALDTVTVVAPGAAPRRQARAALAPGQLVAVAAGETVPVDGAVVAGTATVVEAAITGEPFPVPKQPGDRVHAGSVIADAGYLEVAPELGAASRMDGVLAAVSRALGAPTRIQRDADAILRWFLPVVIVVGILTFIGWAAAGRGLEDPLRAMLAVYLVACPCALGLATPIAVMSALHRLGRIGLAPRSGDIVLKLAEVDTVVLDKTGTLGEGLPAVESLHLAPGCAVSEPALRSLIAAVESRARHPLAAALARLGAPADLPDLRVESKPGLGVIGAWSGGELRVGEPALMPGADFSFASGLAGKRVRVSLDGRAAAVVILRESLRADARSTVQALRDLGLHVRVLTGDPSPAWSEISGAEVTAGLSPADKARIVRQLRGQGARVLFVGDGLNDLEGMSDAHATLAMAAGADLTRHSCDAVVVVDRLASIPESIRLCRRVRSDLRINLLLSAGYNLVGIGLAAAGLLDPMVAAVVMLVSSFLVALRAIRAARA